MTNATTTTPTEKPDSSACSFIMADSKPVAACVSYGAAGDANANADAAILKRARRKIDACVLPILCLSVLLQFLDKFCLSFAKTMGLEHDANLHGKDYAWSGSIFYFGYLTCLPFATVLLQRFAVHRYLAVNVFLWAIVIACHAAVSSPGGLLAIRFLLGFFEGGLIPCTTILTANFYTKEQQVPRAAIWQCFNGVSILIGAPMAYGLFLNASQAALRSWQIMFLILGALTIVLAVVIALALPKSPEHAWFLSHDERQAVMAHLTLVNVDATQGKGDPRAQAVEAFRDVRLYLYSTLPFATSITNGGITVFNTTLIASYGFSKADSLLLTMPSGAVQIVGVLLYIAIFRLTRVRAAGGLTCLSLAVVGAAMALFIPSRADTRPARLAGLNMIVFFVMSQSTIVSFIAANVGGHTKRVIFSTFFQLAYAVGNIVGPQTYAPKDAPDYTPAKVAILVTMLASLVLLTLITFVHWRWNSQRTAAMLSDAETQQQPQEHVAIEGATDKQDKTFRYVY